MNFLVNDVWPQLLCIRVQITRISIESRDLKRRKLVLKKKDERTCQSNAVRKVSGSVLLVDGWLNSIDGTEKYHIR